MMVASLGGCSSRDGSEAAVRLASSDGIVSSGDESADARLGEPDACGFGSGGCFDGSFTITHWPDSGAASIIEGDQRLCPICRVSETAGALPRRRDECRYYPDFSSGFQKGQLFAQAKQIALNGSMAENLPLEGGRLNVCRIDCLRSLTTWQRLAFRTLNLSDHFQRHLD